MTTFFTVHLPRTLLALLFLVSAADGFGLPVSSADALPWLRIKAGRDLGIGLMLLAVLLQRQRRVFGAIKLRF